MTSNRRTTTLIAGLALCGALIVTTAVAAPPKHQAKKPASSNSNAALIAAGKKVYAANGCAACHKIADKGGAIGPDLTKTAAESKHTSKWLEVQVVNPKEHNPDSKMPAYGERIKGKDLSSLVAYLSSLKK